MKAPKKIINLFLASIMLLFSFVPLFIPQKAYANDITQDLTDRAVKIQKLEAFKVCVRKGLDPTFPSGGSPFVDGNEAAVGHLVDSVNGVWGCKLDQKNRREDAFFKLLLKDGSSDKYYTGLHSGDDAYSKPENNNVGDCQGDNDPAVRFRKPNTSGSSCDNFYSGDDDQPGRISHKSKVYGQIQRSIDKLNEGLSNDDKAAMRYINLFAALEDGCEASGPITNPNAVSGDTVRVGNDIFEVPNSGAKVSVGTGPALGSRDDTGDYACSTIANLLTGLKAAYTRATGETSSTPSTSGTTDPNGSGDQPFSSNGPSCEERMGIGAGWIVCSVVEALSSGIDSMLREIDNLLNVDALGINDNDELRTVWSYFRAIATFALFAVGLVMVISQAIGGGN